ncbi:MAG TPA: prepilin-type N-terminal cleavage/methylation domain-containing protein [Candidatus Saccharimonadales bacterium]|nr:prepilin-type N-terminal cleavage/methylation domain-containing protein [Candidatus Saccharimonadales bacterium]
MRLLQKYPHCSRPKQAGFTLVELLIVMALMGVLLMMITDMFASVLSVQTESEAHAATVEDGRFILSRLSYDVHHASSITTPGSLGGSGATLAIVIGGVTNTYSLSGGNLRLVNNFGTNLLNSSETTVSGLNFQRIGNVGGDDTIRISFTVTSKAAPKVGPKTQAFTLTTGRR